MVMVRMGSHFHLMKTDGTTMEAGELLNCRVILNVSLFFLLAVHKYQANDKFIGRNTNDITFVPNSDKITVSGAIYTRVARWTTAARAAS
jgi:hypothetical protein